MKKLIIENLRPYVKVFIRNYMPRWFVFVADLTIVTAVFFSLWLFRDAVAAHKADNMIAKYLITIVSYTTAFAIVKTYRGIIRYTSAHEARTIFRAVSLATLIYIIINSAIILGDSYTSQYLIVNRMFIWFSLIMGIAVVGMQVVFRLIVKAAYEVFEESQIATKKDRVFILGTSGDSVKTATQVINDSSSTFKPVAFITLNTNKANKSIFGIPTIHINGNLKEAMDKNRVKGMLVTKEQLNSVPKEFYDKCIIDGLDLYLVNSITKYDNGNTPPQINKIKIEDLLGRNTIEMNKELIKENFNNKVVMVTGAAGSIGSEICRQVLQFNCKKLILVDQAETPMNDLYMTLSAAHSKTQIVPVVANVSDKTYMERVFEMESPNIVFHAAAYKHVPMMEMHPCTAVVTNVLGTKVCADLSAKYGVERFVMISTDKAVNPTNVMGATKRAAEMYVQSLYFKQLEDQKEKPTDFVTTRFGNVLGSNGSVVPLFKKQIMSGGPVTITHRDITRFFMTIPEACSLVLEAGCTGHGGEIYLFDMGEAVKIYDLAVKMIRLSGKIPGKEIDIVETGLREGEKLYEELLANAENTLPTYHKKVMKAKVSKHPYKFVETAIIDMLDIACSYQNPTEVVRKLKRMIPEYKSNNSKFQELDIEIENSINIRTTEAKFDALCQ